MGNNKIFISGIAIREGLSKNGRKYISEELKKFAPTLKNKPILKDHESLTDNVIGKITDTEILDNGKLVSYKGWIKEDGSGIIERIKDGRICEVSIGAMSSKLVKEKEEDDFVIPTGMVGLEMSTTPTPGVDGTSLSIDSKEKYNYTEESIKQIIDEFNNEILIRCPNCNVDVNSTAIEDNICPKCGKDITIKIEKEEIITQSSKEEIEQSQSLTNDRNKIEKEERMEAENNAVSTSESVAKKEIESLKAELDKSNKATEEANKATEEAKKVLEVLEKEKAELKEARRKDAISRYQEKANAKGLKVKDLSGADMEMIKFATEMVDETPEPETKEPEKEPETKEKAKPQSKDVNSNVESTNKLFEGYILTTEDCDKGFAFYRNY